MEKEKTAREKLIEMGLWEPTDPRNPQRELDAAVRLNDNILRRLNLTVAHSYTNSGSVRTFIDEDGQSIEALGANYQQSICALALKLHEQFKKK